MQMTLNLDKKEYDEFFNDSYKLECIIDRLRDIQFILRNNTEDNVRYAAQQIDYILERYK